MPRHTPTPTATCPMLNHSVICPRTRTSTLQLATIVFFVLLMVSQWPAADSRLYLTKCCNKSETFVGIYECSANNRSSSHEFRVPKSVNESGAFGFYSSDEYDLYYGMLFNSKDDLILFPTYQNAELVQKIPKPNKSDQYFDLLETGYLNTVSGVHSPENYSFCFDELLFNGSFYYVAVVLGEKISCRPHDPRFSCPCVPGVYDDRCPAPSLFYIYAMATSLPFLFLTFAVYASSKKRRDLHRKCIMCYSGNVFVSTFIFIVVQWITRNDSERKINCSYLGYLQLFLSLSEYSWVNVICFDMFWDIYTQRFKSRSKKKELFKLIKYSIYAWGYSFLITLVTFLRERSYLQFLPDPEIDINTKCMINKGARWMYLHGPATTLLISNLLMCVYNIYVILKQSKLTKKTLGAKNGCLSHTYKKVILCVKLSIIAGVWLMVNIIIVAMKSSEMIDDHQEDIGLCIGSVAQGVFICLSCVCNKKYLRLIKNMFCSRISCFTNESTENSTQMTSRGTLSTTTN